MIIIIIIIIIIINPIHMVRVLSDTFRRPPVTSLNHLVYLLVYM